MPQSLLNRFLQNLFLLLVLTEFCYAERENVPESGSGREQSLQNSVEEITPDSNEAVIPLTLSPLDVHETTTMNIVSALKSRHYEKVSLDDVLSSRILTKYISAIDPGKSYFLEKDIEDFKKFETELDDRLKKGDVSPAFYIFNRYHSLSVARFEEIKKILGNGLEQFDFSINEKLLTDRADVAWEKTISDLDDLWRKRLKNSVINLLLTGKELHEIQEILVKRYANRLSRALQTNSEDVYQLFVNTFTKTYDPHTQYLSPSTFENFNIGMSLSLEGIGAVLQIEDEYTKVVELVPAGPADKEGSIKPNDKITGVAQGQDGKMIDVIGWRLDEVVKLIRGEKNTLVRLEIIPANEISGLTKEVKIVRKKVELEEQTAKSRIIEINDSDREGKIGVIDIPTFYVDFEAIQKGDKNFRSTTRDVRNLIAELVSDNVQGLVVDLRGNGGGSLEEVRTLTGLFIDKGPVVQIKTKNQRIDILSDRSAGMVYKGPLVVLVDRLSASASEIFAGAIQDYERGLVIGAPTFGKGTVQAILPLNRGQLKLTQAKFYRVSGDSTQERGITPDIEYPLTYDPEIIGESSLEDPLPWDRVLGRYVEQSDLSQFISILNQLHRERVKNNPDFIYRSAAFQYRKTIRDQEFVSLNKSVREKQRDERDTYWLGLENNKRSALGQDLLSSLSDLDNSISSPDEKINPNEMDADQEGEEKKSNVDAEKNSIKMDDKEPNDPLLVESGRIILDIISLRRSDITKPKSHVGL